MTPTVSASESASSWSCVTRMAVALCARMALTTARPVLARRAASSEENGSSRSRTVGSGARARATATRCCCPPDSSRRPSVRELGRELDEGEQLGHARAVTFAAGQTEGDVRGDVEVGEERTLLGDEPDLAALRGDDVGAVGDELAVDRHGACVRCEEAGDEPQQRGLAAAGRPEHGHDRSVLDVEVEPVECRDVAEPLDQPARAQ